MLPGKQHGRNKVIGIALELRATKAEQDFVILVEDQTVFWAVDAKVVQRGTHLRRESEIGGGPLWNP